ncbi:hypothetical protein [Rhodococcus xishaensis]|uniref:Uncharacterized protein n=1 Tax=Rhodococcus xishaensis TaxID=2487364 RepID=A0A3S3A9S1_9NOCA|nr:hypothetical protein [Rhodococcus xishaensis]RVW03029.1 hypothetical protein EGT50_09990 [Rhodococcus xishaensis]
MIEIRDGHTRLSAFGTPAGWPRTDRVVRLHLADDRTELAIELSGGQLRQIASLLDDPKDD